MESWRAFSRYRQSNSGLSITVLPSSQAELPSQSLPSHTFSSMVSALFTMARAWLIFCPSSLSTILLNGPRWAGRYATLLDF